MSTTKCPSCSAYTSFRLVTKKPAGTDFEQSFLACTSCSAVVGVVDSLNTGKILIEQNEALQELGQAVQAIADHLQVTLPRRMG